MPSTNLECRRHPQLTTTPLVHGYHPSTIFLPPVPLNLFSHHPSHSSTQEHPHQVQVCAHFLYHPRLPVPRPLIQALSLLLLLQPATILIESLSHSQNVSVGLFPLQVRTAPHSHHQSIARFSCFVMYQLPVRFFSCTIE